MPTPPRPLNEAARLASLRSSRLLETEATPELDAIVSQAAALFDTPIAAVTLLDETHQRFKASKGLGVPYTSRDEAFCNYTIQESDALIVLDAQADARFADNPLVLTQPGIHFYVGMPVFGPGQQPLGALCVMDTVPRTVVYPMQMSGLKAMADRVSRMFTQPPPLK